MSDWTTTDLKQRSVAAIEYRDYANIPVGDDTYKLPYQLLDQEQQLEVQSKIDMSSIAEVEGEVDLDEDVEHAEERVQELQAKDELTDAEEDELREAQSVLLREEGQIMDALGKETFMAFYDAGRAAVCPDDEDVEYVLENPLEAKQRFEDIDSAPALGNNITRDEAERALRREMLEVFDEVPFMIYFTLGQQVWEESQSAGELVGTSEDGT